ncbi:MAG TPA: hypothetical protein VN758_04555 [Solirubrobacterales bacterium]|nr:hypothetical protein [Solirubrobacterales bacterium]
MLGVALIVITVLFTVLAERIYNVPREMRRNNERIRNRDEDLRTWIEDDRKQARREVIRIHLAESRRTDDGPDYSVSQIQRVKDEVLHRYRDQLRDAERVVRDVRLSEQLPHRLARRIFGKAVPDLTAPTEKANVIADWETSAEDEMASAKELRVVAERRRAEAGKPPLRPLRFAEIV